MINLSPEYLVIQNCLKTKVSLQEAYFKVKTTTTMSSLTFKNLSHNIKLILNHYFSLSYNAFYLFPTLKNNSNESILIIILLAHFLYLNDDKEELKESYFDIINEQRLNLNEEDYNKIFNFYHSKVNIYNSIDDELLTLSLKLEIPLFLLKVMLKEYDKETLLKLAKSLHGNDNNLYLQNTSDKINDKRLKEFVTINNINTYIGKVDHFSNYVKDKLLLKSSYLVLTALNEIKEFYGVSNILISNLKDYLLPYSLYVFLKNRTSIQISAFISNPFFYRKAVEYNDIKKISINNAPIEMIKTYISFKSKNIVICFGNSNLTLNRNDKSLLIKFKENDISKEYKRSLNNLIESSAFVSSSSYLIYINYSFLKQVNEELIKNFVNSKTDFELYKEGNTFETSNALPIGYYAILKRK